MTECPALLDWQQFDLGAAWRSSWQCLGFTSVNMALLDQVLIRYREPQRHYHNLQHLAECLLWLERAAQCAVVPAEVGLALWFHDAIYDLQRHDNEEQSATWAQQALLAEGVALRVAEQISQLILATCHVSIPHTPAERWVVDIDLAILGASSERFAEYEKQIRREYAQIADEVFYPARKSVLRAFQNRPRLYLTDYFHSQLESQARENLSFALRE